MLKSVVEIGIPRARSGVPVFDFSSASVKLWADSLNWIMCRMGCSRRGIWTTASISAAACGCPCQIQLRIPPPCLTGIVKSVGATFSRPKTSKRLDLPDPLGPISTVNGDSSRSMPSGPNDNRFRALILRNIRATIGSLWGERLRIVCQLRCHTQALSCITSRADGMASGELPATIDMAARAPASHNYAEIPECPCYHPERNHPRQEPVGDDVTDGRCHL